ncbi:MAG: hypothetical protein JSS04_00855 [Proteobacteria bacterium]|nr:hypothetical protein [Pseudomonadota bacterium]
MSRADGAPAATWAEFARPDGPAEWRYNEWIRREVAERPRDKFAIESLYRSDRLISARYSFHDSVNVDATRWTLLSPDDLVSLGAAANACWRQFANDKERGAAFARDWATERPWVDRDFELGLWPEVMREIIGPDVLDPVPSAGRTLRVFVWVLRDQARWTFGDLGARVDFGELLGKQAGPFSCSFVNADLKAIARAGAAVPP